MISIEPSSLPAFAIHFGLRMSWRLALSATRAQTSGNTPPTSLATSRKSLTSAFSQSSKILEPLTAWTAVVSLTLYQRAANCCRNLSSGTKPLNLSNSRIRGSGPGRSWLAPTTRSSRTFSTAPLSPFSFCVT